MIHALPLARLEDVLPFAIPIIIFMIPIIAILTRHQQRMAELMHQRQPVDDNVSHQLMAMQVELRHLRELTTQNTLALDDVRSKFDRQQERESGIPERLQG